MEHEVLPGYFEGLGEVVDLLVGTHLLIDGVADDPVVPQDLPVLHPGPLHVPILLQRVLYQTNNSVCESVLVAVVLQLDVQVTPPPVLEN